MKKKYNFLEIFQENYDGTLSPLRTIMVNTVIFRPEDRIAPGMTLSAIDFHELKYLDFSAEEWGNGILKLVGFYKYYAPPKQSTSK